MRLQVAGYRAFVGVSLFAACLLGGAGSLALGLCGPFTDVAADSFCPFVLEVFTLGITTGTSPTTYDPTGNVNRLQMATFLSRGVDGVLKRGSRRAPLIKFWNPQGPTVLGLTTVSTNPSLLASDGEDLWVGCSSAGKVSRVHASDGRLLSTWTGADSAAGVVVAMGRVLVAGGTTPGSLYLIDPGQPAGAVTTVAASLGPQPFGIAFDGARFWVANNPGTGGSVSIVTPGATIPWSVTTISITLGTTSPAGPVFDGTNIWVTDAAAGTIVKLNSSGTVLQTVTVGSSPLLPAFDGANIWVPNLSSDSVTVVRASTGAVLQTLTGNGLDNPISCAFDGERVLATSINNKLSLWKAADLSAIGSFATGGSTSPYGSASDGYNFWIAFNSANKLARF